MYSTTFPKRRRVWVAAIAAVVVVLALIAFVILRDPGEGSANPTPDKPQSDPSPSSSSASACDLPDGDQTIPTKGPAAEWVVVAGFAEPRSSTFGPGDRTGSVGSCFARNPTGATYAVANYFGDSVAPSRDRDRLISRFFDDENKAGIAKQITASPPKNTSGALQIVGFRVIDYTRDRATIDLAFRTSEGPNVGQLAGTQVTVAWQGDDWRVVAPASGRYETTTLATPDGYIEWGAR